MKPRVVNERDRVKVPNDVAINASRRRPSIPSRSGGSYRFASIAVLLCVIAMIGLGVDYVLQPQRFPTKQINIQGDLTYTEPVQIRRAIAKVASTNILRVDIAKAAQIAESLPWVDDVIVKRRWPDTIDVYVNERVMLAQWNENEWLDQVGTPVELLNVQNLDLPHLKGPKGSEQEMLANLQNWRAIFNAVGLKLVGLYKSKTNSWTVLLQNDEIMPPKTIDEVELESKPLEILVKLGSNDPRLQALRFSHLFSELLQPVSETISEVDMRYPDGISVLWVDGKSKLKGHGKYKVQSGV